MRQQRFRALALLCAVATCCGRSGKSASTPESPGAQLAPPPRAIRIEADSIVLEGRWHPTGEGADTLPNSVKVTCARGERRCREELTTAREGQAAMTESFQYGVTEWTKAKLVAVRRASGSEVELRVAFTAAAAEKVTIAKKSGKTLETRWRLE